MTADAMPAFLPYWLRLMDANARALHPRRAYGRTSASSAWMHWTPDMDVSDAMVFSETMFDAVEKGAYIEVWNGTAEFDELGFRHYVATFALAVLMADMKRDRQHVCGCSSAHFNYMTHVADVKPVRLEICSRAASAAEAVSLGNPAPFVPEHVAL